MSSSRFSHNLCRYLAIHHYLAELIQRISTLDLSKRKDNILLSRKHYEDFLKLLDSYDILGSSDSKLFEAYTEDKANFSTTNTRDAAARRDAKIARFREEKELKRKLEVRAYLYFFFPLPRVRPKTEPHTHKINSTSNKTPNWPRTTTISSVICT